jgi:hypothetical protein
MSRKDEQKNTNGHDSGGIKVRVIEFELHGKNVTVSEGIKAITEAIIGRTVVVAEPRRPALPAAPRPVQSAATVVVEDEPEEQLAEQAQPAEEYVEEEGQGQEEPSNGGPKRNYTYRPPKFLDDLDLSKATKSIADFMAEKGNPEENNDRFIVVAVWLKEYMKVENFTINHIYTVFDNLGLKGQIPVNHSQPLRDLKTKRHFLTKTKDGYQVNWQGTQHVANLGAKK